MKLMLMAAVLITMPAIVVAIFFFGRQMMIPAIASLLINIIPFLVAGMLIKPDDDEAIH